MGEFSKVNLGCHIIGFCGLFFGGEISQMNEFSIQSDRGLPLFQSLVPDSSLVAAAAIPTDFLISHVYGMRALSKIPMAIIKRVMIFVIAFFSLFTVENNSVHFDSARCSAFMNSSCSVKTFRVLVPYCAPVHLVQKFEIIWINNGILALRKWNKTVRIIKRLKNDMTLDLIRSTLVGHWSTSNGLLLSAAIL